MTASIVAPIKINIALHVGPPRRDGYHPVDTLCIFPAIGDVLAYEPDGQPGIDLSGDFAADLQGEDHKRNLVWRAFSILGVPPEGRFLLVKTTPVASGVGAGTADGCAAMLLLNDVLDLDFDADQLTHMALGLGADGPVCMAAQIHGGGLWRAEGIGERLTWEGRIEPVAIVVANPGFPVPTGQVFKAYDREPTPLSRAHRSKGEGLHDTLAKTRNDLEPPAIALRPGIAGLRDLMAAQPGARGTRMSGSGGTCYALHASRASADRAAVSLQSSGFWAESAFILPG
ncbi:MAG: 4-(cytidine 5'-diphospho)-2-C-methyl-D-erythritol kinase [Pseudomonadota bacterium]